MRSLIAACLLVSMAMSAPAANVRVAVLDFEDVTATPASEALGIKLDAKTFAQKGALLLSQQLVFQDNYSVVDRRDFIAQMEKSIPKGSTAEGPRPSFIHAAQLLRVDAVLRGSLMSLSSSTKTVNPTGEGRGIEFKTITVSLMVQALDTIDGTVLAAAKGSTSTDFRQSASEQTALGEADLLSMFEKALDEAVAGITKGLEKRLSAREKRAKVSVTVKATEDPALVEIDGVLVGSTPMIGLQVYKGDHTLTVSRPNYTPISKRLVLESDVEISVPMFRLDLTAQERKEILSSAEMKAYFVNEKPDMLIQEIK